MGEKDGIDGKEEGRKEGNKEKGAEIEQASSRQRIQTEKRGRLRVKMWKRHFNDEERKGDKERIETRKRGRCQPLELIALDD